MSDDYRLIRESYRSGQMSERQWQEHLRDPLFRLWVERQSKARGLN